MTNAREDLIEQLEQAFTHTDMRQRAETLRRVTDLFVFNAGRFSDAQLELFDEVMMKLAEGLEVAARAAFGSRLARTSDAPLKIIRLLAFDAAIEVAGPVLAQSSRVSDEVLVENASTMSQDHLLAISRRRQISEVVTDVLVDRGNDTVVSSTASNDGSRFSKRGFSQLVEKSVQDTRLALCLWSRPDVPRQELMKLFARDRWTMLAHLLIFHGRRICDAKKPRCGECVLAAICPSAGIGS